MKGPAKDAYLANPWHASHPDHPVTPAMRPPTTAAVDLYARLDELRERFADAQRNDRAAIRLTAEAVALRLLIEGEMPSRVAERAPLSVAHLRVIARRAGLGPARPGPKLGHRARQKLPL
ncbi:hypothetical protein GCM10010172_07290 [Paractinoplanes ferrugineus]|uniref:Uncharacterized protein n=2 Tax=Paractinoplanes ferrugineus TaxID=113564 RepID=A0A919JBI6_9ACTN|nr:hypothetical protein Afe05nite_86320 [Actinoplanes ferrugineus]